MNIHKTLVGNGSSVNILYLDALKKMGLDEKHLHPTENTMNKVPGDSVNPIGNIELTLTMEGYPRQRTTMV